MEKEQCYDLGFVSKTQGYKGTLILHLEVDFPESYKNLESVYVLKNNKLIPFFIEHIYIRNNGFAVVKFEGVNTDKKAKLFLKCGLFLPLETLPELEDNEFYYFEIEGFTVVDSKFGQIGKVSKVIDLKGNPLIEILRGKQEILLPKQDEFIDEVNWDTKTLYISAPEGLLEMYFEEE